MEIGNTRLAKTILTALVAGVVLSFVVVGVLVLNSEDLDPTQQRESSYGVTAADGEREPAPG